MPGLDIFHNNGDLVHSSRERVAVPGFDDVGESLSDLNVSQFWFHYHPRRNFVICFFKGFRNVSEQFYGVYKGHELESDTLDTFKRRVENAFENEGWSTSESGAGGDAIYTDLGTASPVELAVAREHLEQIRPTDYNDSPVQLGAPDNRTALRVCKRLVEHFGNDVKVTVCGSGVVDNLPPSDFVVVPNTSEEPGELILGAHDRLERANLRDLIDDAREEVEQLVSTTDTDSGPDGRRAEGVAAALEELDVAESGIDVDTEERRALELDWTRWTAAVAGGTVTLLVSLVATVLVGEMTAIVSTLQRKVYPTLPAFVVSQTSVELPRLLLESWQVIAASFAVLFVTTLDREDVHAVARKASSVLPDQVDRRPVQSDEVTKLVRLLHEIAEHNQVDHQDFGGFAAVGRRIFEGTGLKVTPRRERRIKKFKAAITWFGLGTAVTCVFVVVFALLALGLSRIWTWFLTLLSVTAWGAIGWRTSPYAVWFVGGLWEHTWWLRTGVRKVGAGTVDVWTAVRPRRTYSTRGEVLRYGLGFVVTAPLFVRMAGGTWASQEGLGYQVVVGAAQETVGRTGIGKANSVAVVYFLVLAFVLGLVAFVLLDDRYRVPAGMLFLGVLRGAGVHWEAPLVTVRDQLIPVWIVVGGLLAVGVVSSTTYTMSTGRRNAILMRAVAVLLGTVVVVAFLEQHIEYAVPLTYDRETNRFIVQSAGSVGVERLRSLPVDITVFVLVLTGLWSVSTGANKLDVLVLGPRRSQADLLVGALYHTITEKEVDFEAVTAGEASEKIHTLFAGASGDPGSDFQLPDRFYSNVAITSLEFDARAKTGHLLHVQTSQFRKGELDDIATEIEHIAREGRFRTPKSRGAAITGNSPQPSNGEDPVEEAAKAYLKADVIVLALPVDDAVARNDYHVPPDQTVGSSGSNRYVDVLQALLTKDGVDTPRYIFGVGTGAASLARDIQTKSDESFMDKLRRQVRREIFDRGGSRSSLIHNLDGSDRASRVIPFYVVHTDDGIKISGAKALLDRIEQEVLQVSSEENDSL